MSAACCKICGEEMHYRCLSCTKPICNRSNNCSITAPEETTGWKAGSLVSFCVSCTQTAETGSKSLPSGTRETKKPRQDSQPRTAVGSHLYKKRKCLDLSQKFAVLEYAKNTQILEAGKLLISLEQAKPRFKLFYETKNQLWHFTKVTSVETKWREVARLNILKWMKQSETGILCVENPTYQFPEQCYRRKPWLLQKS